MSFQSPIKEIPAPWFFGELSAWLFAGLFITAFAALGFSQFFIAAGLGAVAGVLLFMKLSNITKDDPAEGLYFCSSCKYYFKESSVIAPRENEDAI
jgi:hypothetical protein